MMNHCSLPLNNIKIYGKELRFNKLCYSEHILQSIGPSVYQGSNG